MAASARLPLIGQGVDQGNQRRLTNIGHQGQLIDHIGQAVGLMPTHTVEKIQPGIRVILKVAFGEALPEHLRGQLGGDVGLVVAEYPVDFLAPCLGDVLDGLAYLPFPGLAGEDARHARIGGKQRPGVGFTDHVLHTHIWVLVSEQVEDLLVQVGFGIALAQLAE
ncbi:hypothetical protein D3C76_727720 [compost metagenome]